MDFIIAGLKGPSSQGSARRKGASEHGHPTEIPLVRGRLQKRCGGRPSVRYRLLCASR